MFKVILLSGMIGEYIMADCYIDNDYFDFYFTMEGYKLINEWGHTVPMSQAEFTFIELELRRQYQDKQS